MFVSLRKICLILCFDCIYSVTENDDGYSYSASFTDKIKSCEGFDNTNFISDGLEVTHPKNDSAFIMVLQGDLVLKSAIEQGSKLEVDFYKWTDTELVYWLHGTADICSNLQDDELPIYPLIQQMNVESCPIAAGTYHIEEMELSLKFAHENLDFQFTGDYVIEMSIATMNETILSCHVVDVEVREL